VTSLPPFGCVPAAITLFGHGSNECVTRLNEDAKNFNKKLNYTVDSLTKQYSDLKIAVLDIYQPLYDLVTAPEKQGTSNIY
jgi:GDSL-like Lipase/Acylhydrolase